MAVLLVEDDPMIRLTLADFLEEAGLHVCEARDANEAVAILCDPGQAIDILVTDLNLGHGDNGLVLAQQAKQLLPDLRVIYITGSPEILEGHTFAAWEQVFLKPFSPRLLVAAAVAVEKQGFRWRSLQLQLCAAGMAVALSLYPPLSVTSRRG